MAVTLGMTRLVTGINLKKGQLAMATAMIYPEEGKSKGGRGKKSATVNRAETAEFSRRRLEQARQVLRYSKALAREVLLDNVGLDEAPKNKKPQSDRSAGA
jgi:hypothetical protein